MIGIFLKPVQSLFLPYLSLVLVNRLKSCCMMLENISILIVFHMTVHYDTNCTLFMYI